MISAVDIKKLWYADHSAINSDLTGKALAELLNSSSVTEILNLHQDTWSIEESESSQDTYKNQLTGSAYRVGAKTLGDVTISFTIGQYDYATKAALMGGVGDAKSWKRERGIVEIKKAIIALTEDNQYIVIPYCNLSCREANTDGAIGLSVTGTMLEPINPAVMPEYWFDSSVVVSD